MLKQEQFHPMVTILMLTWNRARYIKEAVESILSQSYENWELVIIDDGSTDETSEIISIYTDQRIKYFRHEENEGLLARRKESLERATGKYVAVLDSDDSWIDKNKLSEQVALLENSPEVVVVGTFIAKINSEGNVLGSNTYETEDSKIRKNILLRNQFTHSSIVMRRDAVNKTKGYTYPLAEDWALILELGRLGKLINIPKEMTAYRIHGESESAKKLQMAKTAHQIIIANIRYYPGALHALFRNLGRILSSYR